MHGTLDGRWEDTGMDAVRDAGMDERLTVAEAADRLGITKEAVRKRIHRGTLRTDRAADGTVMVYVPPSGTPYSPERELLYEEMRERIAYLERQIEEEREARRRADTLLARLMDRVPELEAPREKAHPQKPPETTESPADEQQGRGPAPDSPGPPTPAAETAGQEGGTEPPEERRGFWSRLFGT